ncbi:hypothetical protein IEC_05694 [Bacillus toyonensis]|nr:hypothetical protein IEC_05694 [Bacillus toyonensis]
MGTLLLLVVSFEGSQDENIYKEQNKRGEDLDYYWFVEEVYGILGGEYKVIS